VAVPGQHFAADRAGVDADPDGGTRVLRRADDFLTFQVAPMLPGLTRTLSNPAASAARASL
jgi:hypothetical protein